MNWKSEAMDRLRQYDSLRMACSNIPQEIQRLRSRVCRTRGAATETVGTAGGYDRGDTAMLNDLVQLQELSWNLSRSKNWVAMTDRALRALTEKERLILSRLYIYPETGGLERLCRELGLEKSSVYRHRDRALQKFTLALYGLPEPWQAS